MSTILDNRPAPELEISPTGQVSWKEVLVDHDAEKFYRGKQVTAQEYNQLFNKHASTSNYTADTLKQFLEHGLNDAIYRQVKHTLNLHPSYVKIFVSSDWGTADADGYYHITIPASEHGFAVNPNPDMEYDATKQTNIAAVVYLLDNNGEFYEVDTVTIDTDNTVTIYSDDFTLSGFVIIRTNSTAYEMSSVTLYASQIIDLADVAISNSYNDLDDLPTARFQAIESEIANLKNGTTPIAHATTADSASAVPRAGRINGINVSAIFEEEGSRVVKEATNATNASNYNSVSGTIKNKFAEIEGRLDSLGFRQGSVTLSSGTTAETNILTRQGNYVLGKLVNVLTPSALSFGTVPAEFRPKATVTFGITGQFLMSMSGFSNTTSYGEGTMGYITITNTGDVSITRLSGTVRSEQGIAIANQQNYLSVSDAFTCYFGYEANPIQTE